MTTTSSPTARICGVTRLEQRGDAIYTFTLPADMLLKVCRVERFGECAEGVNRKFSHDHALAIADAMLDARTLWLEPILGDLQGEWEYTEEALIFVEGTSFISVDDGQHRLAAFDLLNPGERERFEFTVTVTRNLPYERRLVIFRMQDERRALSRHQTLAISARLGDWKKPLDAEAYSLVCELNSSPNSPLRGMIVLEEQERRAYEARHRPTGINGNGLFATMRSILGSKSPLHELSASKRSEVVMLLLRLAADIWKKEWCSDKHMLTTARGINAVLKLMLSSPNFRGAIGDDFTQDSLRRGLQLAASFDWSASKNRNVSERDLVSRLDQAIGKNRSKSERAAVKA